MEPVNADHFPTACPNCHGHAIHPLTQQSNFAEMHPAGAVEVGSGHVSTTRHYRCDACGHEWAATVPHRD